MGSRQQGAEKPGNVKSGMRAFLYNDSGVPLTKLFSVRKLT